MELREADLSGLDAIYWSKKKPGWENICIIANSVVSNRQTARAATKALIKAKLGLALTVGEERTLARPRRAAGSSRWTSFSPLGQLTTGGGDFGRSFFVSVGSGSV